MTYEATRIVAAGTAPSNPIRYTCVDGTGIEKGAILRFSGSQIVTATNYALGDVFAGIANTEKVANDGSTSIGVDTCGIYDCLVSACAVAVRAGSPLMLSGAGTIPWLIPIQGTGISGAACAMGLYAGKALESVAINTSDTIAVAIGVY